MEVKITAQSQAEFDLKRDALVKALSGPSPMEPRKGFFAYQNVLLSRLNRSYNLHMNQAKREIDAILKRHL